MLKRRLWLWMAPYVAQAITASLLMFYQQLVAAGMLQNVPAQQAGDPSNPQGHRVSDLHH